MHVQAITHVFHMFILFIFLFFTSECVYEPSYMCFVCLFIVMMLDGTEIVLMYWSYTEGYGERWG